ncbi:winged helix family transcriptional regulator [Kribbella sp. ALI-6-A]|uniref:winged helix-turn-helix domain-containing protein n=1 Tax=Kribbella sp. ALI-6-A TaxID=1933817 RepID=UPI00097BE872|nr:winged helix-turn-helix domain-containing protein [Kribbella sp. ALI-6-A]ONI72412.1 winged helix family transcriptional regulator [Kribbella sp. ALI-6-A]
MVTARVPAPRDDGTIDHQTFPLLIAVAASPEERVRLAELVDDVAPLLLVSSLDELRKLLLPAQDPPPSAPAEQSAPSHTGAAQAGTDALTIDSRRSVAQWRGREVPLTDLEHDLLTRLMTEPVRVWTYEALHQAVWRNRHQRGTGDVHSLVKRVRRKLDDLGTTVTIDAVRGTGFRLADHQRPAITGLRAG